MCMLLVAAGAAVFFIATRWNPTEPVNVPNQPPASPMDPEVSAAEITYISIEWRQPAETGGAAVLGYTVERAATPEGEPLPGEWEAVEVLVGSRTVHGSGNLDGSTRYCFRVSARNNVGDGVPTNATCAETLPPEAPQPVPVIRPVATGLDFITLEWPAANGTGLPVLSYVLEACPGQLVECAAGDQFLQIYQGPERQFSHDGRAAAVFETYRVQTVTDNGPSEWSEQVEFRTDAVDAAEPAQPEPPVQGADPSSSTVGLSWAFPEDGGAQILLFRVEEVPLFWVEGRAPAVGLGKRGKDQKRARNRRGWSGGAAVNDAVSLPWEGWGTALTVADLTSASTYCFTITALNGIGDSAVSAQTCLETAQPMAPGALRGKRGGATSDCKGRCNPFQSLRPC